MKKCKKWKILQRKIQEKIIETRRERERERGERGERWERKDCTLNQFHPNFFKKDESGKRMEKWNRSAKNAHFSQVD